jgi:hypothetical protein
MKNLRIAASAVFGLMWIAASPSAIAQAAPPASATLFSLSGVYQSIPDGTTLPGGFRNSGSPEKISITPAAREQMKSVDLKDDSWKTCRPVGNFRMMARSGTVMEFLPAGNMFFLLFEDFTHGFMRKVYFGRTHEQRSTQTSDADIPRTKFTWFGDSIGRWENDTIVIDTVDFNEDTWLNDKGVPHSEAMRTVERIRPIRGGEALEYRMTVDDPQMLVTPYAYVRYFKKIDREIEDDNCVEEH